MASFVKRPNGKWAYVLYVGRDPETRRHRQRWIGGFRTKREAVEAYEREMARRRDGTHVEPSDLTVGVFLVDRWLPAVEGTVRATTASYHRQQTHLYLVPELGSIRLQSLTSDDLERLYVRLVKNGRRRGNGGLSPQTVRHIHATVRRALTDAVRWRLVPYNVASGVKLPKGKQPEMQVWSPQQLGAFLDHVRDDRLYAAWLLLCTTGLRRGEILGLTWSALHLDRGLIDIVKTLVVAYYEPQFSEPKTAKGRRTLALDAETLQALKAHRAYQLEERLALGDVYDDHDLVFCWEEGRPFHPELLSNWFERHAKAAGLPRIRLHDLRHSYATAALAAGVSVKVVSERLGHANVGITSDLYLHVPDELDRAAAEQVAASILGHRK